MAQSKRQKRIEARNKRDARKFFTTMIIVTLALLILLYIIYTRSV